MHLCLWHLYTIMFLHQVKEALTCSISCTCKWKNGKRTADCSSNTLNDLPDTLDPETQVIDFSDNNLTKLSKELFIKKQLVNLQRLYLSKCRIRNIHNDAFSGLTNLVELDLSYNFLETIPTAAFSNCLSLMKLTLSSNPLKEVKKLAFNDLLYLNTLELSDCEIAEVQEGAFQGLQSLEWLRLTSNRLTTIKGAQSLPKSLRGIELQKNPWICDCHIRDLHEWLLSFYIPAAMEPACTEPYRLRNTSVKNAQKQELACLPEIQPTTLYLELAEGKNVSLVCHIHAVPEAMVSWWFDGKLLQNKTNLIPGIHLVYYVENGTENKRSELFIYNVNAEDNGTYVCHAENSAGITQSNFTIKIVVKGEPAVIIVTFSIEYLMCAVAGASLLAILLVAVGIGYLVRRHIRKKVMLNQNRIKEVKLNIQHDVGAEKESMSWTEKSVSSRPVKQEKQILASITPTNKSDENGFTDVKSCDQFTPRSTVRTHTVSPLSMTRYQLEQNPDLINGTRSIGYRKAGDGEDVGHGAAENPSRSFIRGGVVKEFYFNNQCGLDICNVLDPPSGYPVDYGLPKLSCIGANESLNRTLPCNRNSAAHPLKRYSKEVEFLSRRINTPYDHFQVADIRF